jgi:predicted nucleotidyltransferase
VFDDMLELTQQHRKQIIALCQRHDVKRLELFGSAARADFDPDTSDVDFLVEFQSYESLSIADQWFGLQEDLERLLGRQVDLTSLRVARNSFFLEVANRHKVTLYAA